MDPQKWEDRMAEYFTVQTDTGLIGTFKYLDWGHYLTFNEGCVIDGKHRVVFTTTLYDADNELHAIKRGHRILKFYHEIGENIKWPIRAI